MKKAISLILSLTIIICTGCRNNSSNTNNFEANTVKIVDQANRTVVLPKNINRVISCYYTVTSTIIALGQKDKLVGIEMNANKRKIYQKSAPELLDLPSIGNSKTINIETCASLNSDVTLTQYSPCSSFETDFPPERLIRRVWNISEEAVVR